MMAEVRMNKLVKRPKKTKKMLSSSLKLLFLLLTKLDSKKKKLKKLTNQWEDIFGGIVIVRHSDLNKWLACIKGIKEGEPRFECLECEDFSQCKKCADLKEHPHKMKRFIVPKGCTVQSLSQSWSFSHPVIKKYKKLLSHWNSALNVAINSPNLTQSTKWRRTRTSCSVNSASRLTKENIKRKTSTSYFCQYLNNFSD